MTSAASLWYRRSPYRLPITGLPIHPKASLRSASGTPKFTPKPHFDPLRGPRNLRIGRFPATREARILLLLLDTVPSCVCEGRIKILPKSGNPHGLLCWVISRSGTVIETTACLLETLTGYCVGQDLDLVRWLKPPPAFWKPSRVIVLGNIPIWHGG